MPRQHAIRGSWAFIATVLLTTGTLGQTIITETQYLAPDPPLTGGVQYGAKVAVDASAGVAAVGAPIANASTGAVYVFRNFGGAWLQEDVLLGQGIADDYSVCAVSGNALAVGVPNRASGPSNPGAVDIFRFDGLSWELETTLTQPMGDADDFGAVVLMHEDLLVVSDPEENVPPSQGVVHVYRDQGPGGWVQEAMLTSTVQFSGSEFGRRLATDGQTIAVGEYGMVHVFRLVAGSWVLDAALQAPVQPEPLYGSTGVGILDDVLVVGSTPFGSPQGQVYIYRHDGTAWQEEAILPGNGWAFGAHLGLGQDLVLVGQALASGGTVRLFRKVGGTWTESETLTSSSGSPSFGHPIAVSGDTIVVGASQEMTMPGEDTGAAYLFDLSGAPPPTQLRRGDVNDDGAFDIADAIAALGSLFGQDAIGCVDAADANDDGAFDIADAVSILTSLFVPGAPPPSPPHPGCGVDPTPDPLDCASFASCP